MSSQVQVLPNPNTPLAFLSPTVANQLEVSRYIYVATLGALIWDILSNVPKDYKLLAEHRVTPATATYFSSRIAALAYVITSTVFQIGAVGNCQALQIALGICFLFAVPLTSFLFFLRVRAIFTGQPLVIYTFLFIWTAVLACCALVPFAIHGAHIGTTDHCINTLVKPFSSAGIIASTVHDTCVLVAISARILYNSAVDDNFESRFKSFWGGGGKALPRFSKSILQSGQQYYLITVSGNLLTMIMILTPSVPPVYHAMFTIPNVAIENAMACKVFRDIKFGLIDSGVPGGGGSSSYSGGDGGGVNTHLSFGRNPKATFGSMTVEDLERGRRSHGHRHVRGSESGSGRSRRMRRGEEIMDEFVVSVPDQARSIGSVGSMYSDQHQQAHMYDYGGRRGIAITKTVERTTDAVDMNMDMELGAVRGGATELVVLPPSRRLSMKSKGEGDDSERSRASMSYSEEDALK